MPTPIAHALGGVAAGCLVTTAAALMTRRRPSGRAFEAAVVARVGSLRWAAGLACLGMLPDADLLVGMHRSVAHSVGATLIAAGLGCAIARRDRLLVAATVAAAYGSHLLLDWLGTDPGAPHGIMAWWPWTTEFYLSDAHVFLRVCREYWEPACWRHNLLALGRELVILLPVTLAAARAAQRRARRQ